MPAAYFTLHCRTGLLVGPCQICLLLLLQLINEIDAQILVHAFRHVLKTPALLSPTLPVLLAMIEPYPVDVIY